MQRKQLTGPPQSTFRKVISWPGRMVQKAFGLLNIHRSSWWLGLSGSWKEGVYTELANAGLRNPFVYRSLMLIAQNMAEIPVIAVTEEKGKPKRHPDHEFLKLLRRPNPQQSYRAFILEAMEHLFFGGELFVWAPESPTSGPNMGKPTEEHGLRLIRPDRVREVVRDEDGIITFYKWIRPNGKTRVTDAARINHFILVRNPDENTLLSSGSRWLRGFPILLAAWRSIQLQSDGENWNKSVYQNKGRIPGFFKYMGTGKFDADQFKQTKESIQEAHRKDSEASRPGLLMGDYDFIEAATNQKDADFIRGDILAARKIAIALGVDPSLLGDSENKNYSNMQVALKALIILTVLPLLGWLLAEFNAFYMPLYVPKEAQLGANRERIEALREDENDRTKRLLSQIAGSMMSINEARIEQGLEPSPLKEADIIWILFNRLPIDQVVDLSPFAKALGGGDLTNLNAADFDAMITRLIEEPLSQNGE